MFCRQYKVHVCSPQLLIIYSTLLAEHTSIAMLLSTYRHNVNIDAGPGERESFQLFFDLTLIDLKANF